MRKRTLVRAIRIACFIFLLLPLVLALLVRFTKGTIKYEDKTLLDYREKTGDWIINDWEQYELEGIDGPHIFHRADGLEAVYIDSISPGVYALRRQYVSTGTDTVFGCMAANSDRDVFQFRLQRVHSIPSDTCPMPEKILAISDIEGNFNAFYSLLTGNGVMDKKANWTFGSGHLVLLGDFVDRGDQVTQVLWLIYHLEQKARHAGGQVHYILGNHEAMNLQGRPKYVAPKYLALAQQLSGKKRHKEAFASLMSDDSELVHWLLTKNIAERIGDILFVHGGISPELIESGLSISDLNRLSRQSIRQNLYSVPGSDAAANLIAGRVGPLWYRGLVQDYKEYYKKASPGTVQKALSAFSVRHIVIGHTIVDSVSADYDRKVIRIDVKQPRTKSSGQAQALWIEKERFYRVNDKGQKTPL